MKIKQKEKSNDQREIKPKPFPKRKRFRNRFGKGIKRPMEIKQKRIKRSMENQNETASEKVSEMESKANKDSKKKNGFQTENQNVFLIKSFKKSGGRMRPSESHVQTTTTTTTKTQPRRCDVQRHGACSEHQDEKEKTNIPLSFAFKRR